MHAGHLRSAEGPTKRSATAVSRRVCQDVHGLRLSQRDRKFRQRWLIPLPGHLEREVGAPASLKEGDMAEAAGSKTGANSPKG